MYDVTAWCCRLAAAAIAGALGAAAGSPLFMIKCRIQALSNQVVKDASVAGLGHQHKYTGLVDGFRTVLREEGWRVCFPSVSMCDQMEDVSVVERIDEVWRETGGMNA